MTKVIRKRIRLLPYQNEFVSDITTPHLALVCGLGAGKTKAAVYKTLNLLQENPGCNGIGCEPTGPQLAIFTEEMNATCRDLGLVYGKHYKYIGMGAGHPAYYTFDFGHGPQKLLLVSAMNYKASLVGFNAAFGFVDEMDTIANKDEGIAIWNALNDRLRDPHAKFIQSFVTSTPEGHHIIEAIFAEEVSADGFVTKCKPNHKVIQRSTLDNIYLKPSYIRGQLARYTENQAAAKIYGRFVNSFGLRVYDCFERARNSTTKTLADFPAKSVLHIGMDFNVDNMSATVAVINQGKVYVIDEITGLAGTVAMILEIKKRYPNHAGLIDIYPDVNVRKRSTSADDVSLTDRKRLRDAGFNLHHKGNNPGIKDRVDSVNTQFYNALGEVNCFINIDKCEQLVKGLEQQGWKKGKPDKDSGLDHCLDAFGYFIYYRYPAIEKSTIEVVR
ncbi:hypothetical protein QTI05_24070 [Variovorax sp. J22R193]|uniref:hypothetical protein n=1 Tax=Variovorax fucosicus TaxID=3053517 RepID=UPI0025779F32|nr:hypothetical protein [Variovorax sp. J22R193]MDM0042136.1 hypothetical protein [Variovorax sp. J22R193]